MNSLFRRMSNPKQEEGEVVQAAAKGGNLLLSTDRNGNNRVIGKGNNTNNSSRHLHSSPEQANAIGKFTAPSDYSKGNELNNNSITQQEFHALQASKMDPNRKSANFKPPTSPSEATTLTLGSTLESRDARSLEYPPIGLQTSKDIPTYSSIFAPSKPAANLHRTPSPQPIAGRRSQVNAARPPLVKQNEAESPVAEAINGLAASNKELAAFNYNNRGKSQKQSEEDEPEDDDIDERLPFNSNLRRSQRAIKHGLPESHRCRLSMHDGINHKQSCLAFENQCEIGHQHNKHNHTKISFNDSRPPSFGICQSRNCNDLEASLDRRTFRSGETKCQACDCNDCYRNRKLTLLDNHNHQSSMDSSNAIHPTKYNRTKTLHLVLKSIVLILLTILLLLFLIAILVASHYLPQALERIMNTTRSFNVTIAG